VASEAMNALGVPTTRALSLVGTGAQVLRDMFYECVPSAPVCLLLGSCHSRLFRSLEHQNDLQRTCVVAQRNFRLAVAVAAVPRGDYHDKPSHLTALYIPEPHAVCCEGESNQLVI
jgi:hypothetical protein